MSGRSIQHAVSLLLLAAVVLIPACSYNRVIEEQEAVQSAWAQVESAYQRRADLIPNLQRSVERFLEHERETLESVTETREQGSASMRALMQRLQQASNRSNDLASTDGAAPTSAERLTRLQRVQQQLDQGIEAFMARSEDYPELRSADQFLQLQAQLEGTENLINIARQRYNQVVREYNSAIRGIPGRWIASAMGFEQRPYFESDAGAEEAVELDF